MYLYIRENELVELLQEDRIAYIIEDVVTKSIDEYITNLLIVMKNIGINTGIFLQTKIKKNNTNNNYTILLVVRKGIKMSEVAESSLLRLMNRVILTHRLKDWMQLKYNNRRIN